MRASDAVDFDASVDREPDAVFAEPAYRLRIDAMLLGEHARGKRVFGVARKHPWVIRTVFAITIFPVLSQTAQEIFLLVHRAQ